VVLDTNIVFDWLVFDNAGCRPLIDAVESGRLRWLATQDMRDELAHVLGRGVLAAWSPDESRLWSTWDRLACMVTAPPGSLAPRLRCGDPDDQKFVELALAQAQWLISRDRAVLKLAKRAAALGVHIVTPERWVMLHTGA
jgi:predicted nucleic acid-binding protein